MTKTFLTLGTVLSLSIAGMIASIPEASAKVRTHVCYINGYKHYCRNHRYVQYYYNPYPYMGFYYNNYNNYNNYNHNHFYPRFYQSQPSRVFNINGSPVVVHYSRH